ncbi:Dynein light chain [Melia azedarach]|uniref:Dynein light chain n=1 Tax=Melia azedarach TaxID=155640 RepID=A0ACC1X554_MELAZ|nr:Dynein light chain [Melia azedarach]
MERPESENERRRLAKNKEKMLLQLQCAPRRMLALPPPVVRPPAPTANQQVPLAAVAADLNVRLRSADMPAAMQERVIRHAKVLLDANADNKKLNATHLAMCLKKEFDALYGPAWHCIVGNSFGSFVTHSSGGFVYFSIDKHSFLLFKTEVRPVIKKSPLLLKFKT